MELMTGLEPVAYHLDNNTFNEEKPKTYEEMSDDELDRQYEETTPTRRTKKTQKRKRF